MKQINVKWDAKLYNDKHAFVYHYGESLIKLLDPKSTEKILDLGCGTGELTAKIQAKSKQTIGIDHSPEMVRQAKHNFPAIDFKVADASNFQLEEPVDAIFSNATLHWVANYQGAIQSMYNNLRKGGRIVIEFGGKGNVQLIVTQFRKSLKQRGYTTQANLQLWYFPSISAYTTALEKVGFEVTFAQLYNRPTLLADEATGIKDWLSMFGKAFFKGVAPADIEEIKEEVQASLKPQLFINGKWYADYRRIRVIAQK